MLQRKPHPLAEAVDGQVKVACTAAGITAPLTLRRRPVDELRERLPEGHRRLERLDADAHLVAVLDAVVDVEAVNSRTDQAAKNGEAFCCLSIQRHTEPACAAYSAATVCNSSRSCCGPRSVDPMC